MDSEHGRCHVGAFGLIAAMLFWVVCASCRDDRTRYHHYQSVGGEWEAHQECLFELPQWQAGHCYRLLVDVRYTDAYPYRNLALVITHNLSDSTSRQTDTLTCVLRDERGHPTGKGHSLYQLETFYTVCQPDSSSGHLISLSHGMAGEALPLPGISDVGIRVCEEKGEMRKEK